MITRIALTLAPFFIACNVVATVADASPLIAELDQKSFLETYSPEVSVSGAVIVGVASSRALVGSVTDSLAVIAGPGIGEHKICLTIVSRDGAYYSRGVFTIDLPQGSGGQAVWLPYESGKRDILDAYQDQDIAMLAAAGDCSDSGQSYYVVDTRESNEPESVRIYINSFGATDVYYMIGDAGEPEDCQFIDTGQRTSFDCWCDLNWRKIDAAPQVQILRERFGRELPAVHLKLMTAPRL